MTVAEFVDRFPGRLTIERLPPSDLWHPSGWRAGHTHQNVTYWRQAGSQEEAIKLVAERAEQCGWRFPGPCSQNPEYWENRAVELRQERDQLKRDLEQIRDQKWAEAKEAKAEVRRLEARDAAGTTLADRHAATVDALQKANGTVAKLEAAVRESCSREVTCHSRNPEAGHLVCAFRQHHQGPYHGNPHALWPKAPGEAVR